MSARFFRKRSSAKSDVVGVDVNPWCVKAANENLEWLTREYSLENADFRVLQGDVSRLAQKIGQDMVDCIVTEPDLGPALTSSAHWALCSKNYSEA